MRIDSSELIQVNPNGTFLFRKPTRIGGTTFDSVLFSSGVRVGNLDLATLVGKQLEVDLENGVYVVKAFYE